MITVRISLFISVVSVCKRVNHRVELGYFNTSLCDGTQLFNARKYLFLSLFLFKKIYDNFNVYIGKN